MSSSSSASRCLDSVYDAHLTDSSNDADHWGLADACRTPFAFGLVTLMPVMLMIGALLLLLNARPMLTERLSLPVSHGWVQPSSAP